MIFLENPPKRARYTSHTRDFQLRRHARENSTTLRSRVRQPPFNAYYAILFAHTHTGRPRGWTAVKASEKTEKNGGKIAMSAVRLWLYNIRAIIANRF